MVQIGFKCDKGIMRQNNEDACFVVPGRNVYVVADGVGGNNSGEVASRTAVSEIARMVNEAAMDQYRSPEEIFGFFADIIEDVNEQIYQMGLQSQQNRGMATTIVTALHKDELGLYCQHWRQPCILVPQRKAGADHQGSHLCQ